MGYNPAPWTQLTFQGENIFPALSADNTELLFIRRSPQHSFAQAYSKNLTTNDVKRLTFQNYPVLQIDFYPNSKDYLITSSMHEWIEHPPEIEGYKKNVFNLHPLFQFPDADIYRLSKDYSQLTRMTHTQGFESLPQFIESERWALLSKKISGRYQLHKIDFKSKTLTALTQSDTDKYSIHVQPKTNHRVWTERDLSSDQLESNLFVALAPKFEPQKIVLPKGIYYYPHWHPTKDWILFSNNDSTLNNQQDLFIVRPDGSCKQQLTFSESEELWAQFSPDGSRIVFSSNKSGPFQVFIMDFLPAQTCEVSK